MRAELRLRQRRDRYFDRDKKKKKTTTNERSCAVQYFSNFTSNDEDTAKSRGRDDLN